MSKSLEERFESATYEVKNLPTTPNENILLKLYGFYKQATIGTCNTKEPWVINAKEYMKWHAWNDNSLLSKTQAMNNYILIVNKLFRENNIYKNI